MQRWRKTGGKSMRRDCCPLRPRHMAEINIVKYQSVRITAQVGCGYKILMLLTDVRVSLSVAQHRHYRTRPACRTATDHKGPDQVNCGFRYDSESLSGRESCMEMYRRSCSCVFTLQKVRHPVEMFYLQFCTG